MAKKVKKPARGGKREGAGAPKKYDSAGTVVVYLPRYAIDWIDALPGKRSEAMRNLIDRDIAARQT